MSQAELYKAINSCLKPVKEDIAEVDKRVRAIMTQLDTIEQRVKGLNDQLTNIEEAVKPKSKV
jgi:septal ring factor EnvC (AmiA/AmiB activator)